MSVKRKSYSADFKAKLVLEVLEGEKTVNEIASRGLKKFLKLKILDDYLIRDKKKNELDP